MSAAANPPYLRQMRLLRNVMVPMRDGVRLATTIYLPLGEGPFPVVLVRMSYNRSLFAGYGWADRGIALLVQDTRGRYGSEGDFYPFVTETNDGLDTLDWLAQQPWCDGNVGMFGASYLAGVQLAIAPENHPLIKALNPSFMSGNLWKQAYYSNGVFSLALVFSWLCFECNSRVSEASQLPQFDIAALLRERPVLTIDEKSGAISPYYRDYIEHETYDEFWRTQTYRDTLSRVRTPMLLTGGWYDYYPGETFHNFAALLQGPAEVRGQHRVMVGPWMHGFGSATTLGDIDFGEASLKENDHANRWLGTLLQGGTAADVLPAPVRIFVMGDNVWRDEREWPLARTRYTRYYLRSAGRANTAGGDGRLSAEAPSGDSADHYTYDPADPVPTIGGNHSVGPYNPGLWDICLAGPYDQRRVEERQDVLVYTSEPLAQDLEVTGPVELRLFASSSAVDTDFVGRLCDVYPDGRSINITEGVLRARYRGERWDRPELMAPGRVYELAIELQPTSNVYKRGHRLRLDVTSSSFPLWAPNLNTGGHHGHETTPIVAEQTVLHDAQHPSHLVLPVIPR